jgi:1,4-alpha-glucan branching enzyme
MLQLIQQDPYLYPYEGALYHRIDLYQRKKSELTGGNMDLTQFALGHLFYGLHKEVEYWVFREWAPNATGITLVGDFSNWQEDPKFAFTRINKHGEWQLVVPHEVLGHGMFYQLIMKWEGGQGERFPAYVNRVVQDPTTQRFAAQVWDPPEPYQWKFPKFRRKKEEPPVIYEAHIGMGQEEERVGTYTEFKDKVLPRIKKLGYNVIQLMAIMEHPYYGSFGYQVSNFFAPSSRFGTPEELKALIDEAHGMGIAVVMDIVHSHAVRNEIEGISRQDGSLEQYFYPGALGFHPAWDSRCFDYGKNEVLHFLLSNCRYWIEEYNFDGFRFDGVTSMLYYDRGHKAFDHYDHYFNGGVDNNAVTYLALANDLIHAIKPEAVTIAEDMSGMPGTCVAPDQGGLGFDYRLAMGVPDMWIRMIKHVADEYWNVREIWHELTNRRIESKTVAYAESHDQALVGDKTIIFRLIDKDMYWHMSADSENILVDRGIALHKMIRMVTIAAGGNGYLNFMGNEFGHPQWIDFPRADNDWSYHWARRQWSLVDHPELRYQFLNNFDKDMVGTVKPVLAQPWANYIVANEGDQVLAFSRGDLVFVFNFSPNNSYTDYGLYVEKAEYQLEMCSDDKAYNGFGRVHKNQHYPWRHHDGNMGYIFLYLPTRTVLVLKKTPA